MVDLLHQSMSFFLFNNKVERISLKQLYTTKELGVLGLVNVQVKCQVLLAKTGYGIKQEGNKHVIYLMARGAGMMMQPQSMCLYSLEYWLGSGND